MLSNRLNSLLGSLLAGVIAGVPAPALADDTDIYVGNDANALTSGVRPNVLFVLDTSGSMSTIVAGTGKSRLDNMKDALDTILNNVQNVNVGLMRFTNTGGPILYPVAYVDEDAAVVEGTAGSSTPDVLSRVSDSSDDAEEDPGGTDAGVGVTVPNTVDLTSTALNFGVKDRTIPATQPPQFVTTFRTLANEDDEEQRISNGQIQANGAELNMDSTQINGIRFPNMTIPKGARIVSAYLRLTARNGDSTPTQLSFNAQAADNAAAFVNAVNNISSRPRTTATVTEDMDPWTTNVSYTLRSNMAALVQEVVCRGVTTATAGCPTPPYAGAWASGNALAIIQRFVSGGQRRAYTHNGTTTASRRPQLIVTYEVGSGTAQADVPRANVVGVKFDNVGIPQGATITDARIEFTAAKDSSDPAASFQIKAELADDAEAFATSAPRINGRTFSNASVTWDSASGLTQWTTDKAYNTPNLKGVLQEVVNRSGWCGNNSVSFKIVPTDVNTGTIDSRVAYSRDFVAPAQEADSTFTAKIPILRVQYDASSVPSGGGCINEVIQAQVLKSSDDAEETISNGSVSLTGSQYDLVSSQINGVRFTNLNIPRNTTILEANLVFTANAADSGAATITHRGQLTADATQFSSAKSNISSRSKTTASVTETATNWVAAGQRQVSANIGPIIQEIVNQSGWQAGNDLVLFQTATGTRRARTFNNSPADAPVLRIRVQWGGAVIAPLVRTVRTRLGQIVEDLNASGNTPIVGTLYEAALYFRGGNVFHGRKRSYQAAEKAATRISHPASYRNGTITGRGPGCTPTNPGSPDCFGETISASAQYISPITEQCQANYIVLLTDGQANANANEDGVDHQVSKVRDLVGGSCASASSGELCGRDLARFLNQNDQDGNASNGNQTVQTYTIAFNLSGNAAAIQFTKDLAAEGGGAQYDASSASELADVFQAILTEILDRPASFAAPATTVNAFNRLENGLDIYYAVFKPAKTVRWAGNLKKYKICSRNEFQNCTPGDVVGVGGLPIAQSDGTLDRNVQDFFDNDSRAATPDVVTNGGAADGVPNYADRKIYTYTGSYPLTGTPDLTANTNVVTDANTALTKTLLGSAGMTNAERTTLVDWIRGRDTEDEDADGNVDENRYAFGDPMHANAAVVTFGGTQDAPVQALFLPTNDGGLRMIDASTGAEKWMFIPQELLPLQDTLRQNLATQHVYGLDLPPTVRIRDVNGNGIIEPSEGDFVHVYVGMRDGGRNYYALNVTPGADGQLPLQPRLLWVIQGGTTNYPDLLRSWSQPVLTTIRTDDGSGQGGTISKTVVVFGGGHDDGLDYNFGTVTGGNIVYVVDADTGLPITSIGGSSTSAKLKTTGYGAGQGMDYPVPSNISIFDSNGDGASDRMYFGDLGGQLWRVDLKPTLSSSSTGAAVGVIGKLASVSLTADPAAVAGPHATNTRKFYSAPSIIRVRDNTFSDRGRYDLILLGSGTRQDPLNQQTRDRFYAFRDYQVAGMPDVDVNGQADSATYPTLDESNLFDVTGNPFQTNADGAKQDPTAFNEALPDFRAADGWFIDLKEADGSYLGEKVLSKATVAGGVLLFTTYIPEVTEALRARCQLAAGFSRLYGLNVLTGAARFADWSSSGTGGTGGSANAVTADRSKDIAGGGLASSPVTVAVDLGVTTTGGAPDNNGDGTPDSTGGASNLTVLGCYGSGSALHCENLGVGTPRIRTYWYQR